MSSVLDCNQIDHYALEDLVATSTTGLTYRGTDLRTSRQVAIKIPYTAIGSDPLLSERFRREQEIGRQLNHPSVVKFVADETRSELYLVTEWVQGQTLRAILNDEGKLPLDRALRIAIGICDALEYVHSQGVVHRDLKPENIMVDTEDRIMLLDFGLASLSGASPISKRRITFGELSHVIGTADYISPEQLSGKRGDARSDLYAVGVMLYEMVTGTTPYPGDNPLVIMNSRLINDPIPPREMDPSISAEMQEVLYRALERDPHHRYARAHEFAWDLRHLDRVGVADRPELRNWRPPAPWFRAALTYVGLMLIALVALALLRYAARHS